MNKSHEYPFSLFPVSTRFFDTFSANINDDLNRYQDYCDTNGIDHGECDDTYTVLLGDNPTFREYDALESIEEDDDE